MVTFTIIAGVNGSGKTTISNKLKSSIDLGFTINADFIAKEIGNEKDTKVQIEAGKKAFKLIEEYIERKTDFNFESTFSGLGIFEIIKKAKRIGFKISIIYIAIDKELSKERIKNRVIKGGHEIQNDIIERRYPKSINNFNRYFKLFDDILFFENNKSEHNLLLSIKDKKLEFISTNTPKWIIDKFDIFKYY